jgi:lysophospholipase L1-like esterase
MKKLILANLLIVIFSSLLATKIFLLYRNTLENNGDWKTSKTKLQEAVMGSAEFYEKTQALSKGKLNLGAWHGFQEVIYVDQVDPKLINFDFSLNADSYFYFIFNKDERNFSAIRLSANQNFPNQYVEASNNGEFTKVQTIDLPLLTDEKWHHFSLSFKGTFVELKIDQNSLINISTDLLQKQLIGFRGSLQNTYIDNVLVSDQHSSRIIDEKFENHKSWQLVLMISLLSIIFIDAMAFIIFAKLNKENKQLPFYNILSLNVTIFSFSFSYLIFSYSFLLGQYQSLNAFFDSLKKDENEWVQLEGNRINTKIMKQHFSETSRTRVLFIGSSQTWGAGAQLENETFVQLAENKANSEANQKINYEFINAGVSGADSKGLLKFYRDDWIKLNPDIVIINLSNNDSDENEFKNNLQEFANLSRDRQIKTVFLLEANSFEFTPLELNLHHIMREVASDNNLIYLDVHSYLKEKSSLGIIWWDKVHLTSYGHELVADFLYEQIFKSNK